VLCLLKASLFGDFHFCRSNAAHSSSEAFAQHSEMILRFHWYSSLTMFNGTQRASEVFHE
jgi:hypothetical protein